MAINTIKVWKVAADLLSEHGENAEYDRAIVEMTSDLLGISTDERAETERWLRVVGEKQV